MNAKTRKEIDSIISKLSAISTMIGGFELYEDEIESLYDDENEKFENMSETSLAESEKCQALEEAAESLSEAVDAINEARDTLDEFVDKIKDAIEALSAARDI